MTQSGLGRAHLLGALVLLIGVAACSRSEEAPPPAPTVATATPDVPEWSQLMIGKPIAEVAPQVGKCVGVFDQVSARHTGARPGVEVVGWAYDTVNHRVIDRYVFTIDNRIVGAGEGGVLREDVPAARPDVPAKKSGWHGVVNATAGKVQAWGLLASHEGCPIGVVTL